MLTDAECDRIRQAYRSGMSIREIARRLHHARLKVREVIKSTAPRQYRRKKSHRPKLTDRFRGQIDALLSGEIDRPLKDHYTAAEVYRLLRKAGYEGGYDQVRRYVSKKRDELSPRKPR